MDDQPPRPPVLDAEHVVALIEWLDATADWVRAEQAVARKRGHQISTAAAANRHLYEDAALLLREAYGPSVS